MDPSSPSPMRARGSCLLKGQHCCLTCKVKSVLLSTCHSSMLILRNSTFFMRYSTEQCVLYCTSLLAFQCCPGPDAARDVCESHAASVIAALLGLLTHPYSSVRTAPHRPVLHYMCTLLYVCTFFSNFIHVCTMQYKYISILVAPLPPVPVLVPPPRACGRLPL